jgi:AcrR family transcriptional regulator
MNSEKTTLRVRQKHHRREKMLVAARTLFVECGYTKTTMDAIADRAEVGVATVHTYFSTKEGLFAELARMDMSELQQEGEALLVQLPPDPVEAVKALLNIYMKVQNYISFDVVRDFVSESRKQGPMHEVASWINHWQMDQVTKILEQGRATGTISETLPLQELSSIIIDMLHLYYDQVMSGKDNKRQYEKLNQRIELLFADWRK